MPVKPLNFGSNHLDSKGVSAGTVTLDEISVAALAFLSPIPTRKVSDDLSRDAFGLIGLTTRKVSLKSLTSWLWPLP